MALAALPQIEMTAEEAVLLSHGQSIANRWNLAAPEAAAVNDASELLAIVVADDAGRLRPEKGFAMVSN
jgi:hypothetical protein